MKAKKKILIFIDWFLPGYKAGGPIQSCANLIDHLKEDFDFSLVTRDTDYCEAEPYTTVKSNQWNTLADGKRVYYISSGHLTKKTIQSILTSEEYDAVYLNGIFSFYFTLLPLYLLRGQNKFVLVASRGMLAESALAIKKTKKQLFLFFARTFKLFEEIVFHATKEDEANDIKRVFGEKTKIRSAPNLPKKIQAEGFYERQKTKGSVRLVNIARISPEKNLKYALETLKNVKGNVEFDVYGPVYNEAYWTECKEIIKTLPLNIKVNYKNSIESDRIGEALKKYHFMFMPTQGENFGHIIIESLSSGCPVIISDQTIWRGLENKKAGWDLPLSDNNAFVKAIERIVDMSQEEYTIISKSAFSFAKAYIDNNEGIKQNKDLFL